MKRILPFLSMLVLAACASASVQDNDNNPPTKKDGGVSPIADAGAEADGGDPVFDSGVPDVDQPVVPGYTYKHYDINHITLTGQSNSVANSTAPITLTQPYQNLSFNTGVMSMTGCNDGAGCRTYETPSSFVPLVEGDIFFGRTETACSGFANQVSKLRPDHVSLISLHGRSGNTYWCLRKGGCNYKPGYLSPFDQGMREVQDGKRIAENNNQSYVVRAVLAIHGESDHYSYTVGAQEFPLYGSDGTPNKLKDYSDALLEWQHDYETGIKAITNQDEPVVFFFSGVSGWNDARESRLSQMQLDAHIRSNGMAVLVAPGYPLPFQTDCLHYTPQGQRRLGEYFAKAYHRVIVEGKRWEPVRPYRVVLNNNVITLSYHVPVPPLQMDTASISDPGNFGFDFADDSGTVISNVSVSGPDTVSVLLSKTPGNNRRLTYAQNQVPRTCIGVYGARGNLRDSDKTPSQTGNSLFNWGVPFIQAL